MEPETPEPIVAEPEPRVRRGGDLVVEDPPAQPTEPPGGRLRAHTEGTLTSGSPRRWVGPPVPEHVPLVHGTLELFILDEVDGGHLAFYRDPYGASSCALSEDRNCAYRAELYAPDGSATWSIDLSAHLSRPTYLEIQDVRYAGGTLYFNEACQSYARQANNRCSALVALDPAAGRVLWRTRPTTSNAEFLVLDDRLIVAGYGFTDEKDEVYLIRRADGRILHRARVPSAPQAYARAAGTDPPEVDVTLYQGTQRFRIERDRLVAAP
jgi:outer membrane protein assembly factor BamB